MNEDAGNARSLHEALSRHRILGLLPAGIQDALARALPELSAAAGELIADGDRLKTHLYWLIEGTVQLQNPDGEAVLSLRPGELFGLAQGESLLVSAAQAETACRYTRLDALTAEALRKEVPALAYFLASPDLSAHTSSLPATRRDANGDPALNLMTTPVSALIKRPPVTLSPHTSIRDAAQVMSEQRVSSVLIVEQDLLFGLITDRDLRNRVIAMGMDTARPIADIATLAPMSVDVKNPAFDALLLMARHNIHHVPVLNGQRIAGMITATDLTEQHSTSAVYLAGDVYKQTTVEGLQTVAAKVKRLQQGLAAAEASAYNTGHIVTAITDAITTRLLQLGEAQLGPAPVDYVWVAAGSQARNEQTARSDQDNCLVLDDAYDEAQHGAYFKALARFVCDGLDACGYVYCPGEMMALTDQWRQPRRRWLTSFTEWTSQPDPTALMLTCVFFDMRAVHGNVGLLDGLRRSVLQQTRGNTIFLAHMVGNALLRQPPLGMFKGISTIRSGEHKGTIDLKHHGVVPIVDLARVYALALGDNEINTHDRLTAAAASGGLNEKNARDLQDALEFLAFLRIQHQARQMAAGQPPDNHINPDDLSNFERHQLKDAFVVVQTMQSVMGQRYRM
ncbi:putative nucleotidyltransferase substrate binding domain-containing protein [Hydrogenophaga sp. SL48]|uniref:putative nucleotidyltransferase substrate binding domain-containing protein n=1 Tax=Hydrogenophaga sp. SL48 TaxID=2806347 RepID=UPI001F002DAA|nr:putative nucleotidyltransferase substrate binding domain-containing protein [Hydrogenophaga sp. SL48]UJW83025.1 CBS domain-containing protein [Hydrogenophaga sp. SL48]